MADLTITGTPAAAAVGAAYTFTPTVSGSAGTNTFSLASGSTLPDGLTLDTSSGTISGTPTTAGSSTVTLDVTDGTNTASLPVTIAVTVSSGNKLYFLQSRVEGYRGDQGTGAPVYTSVTADSSEDYALPYTTVSTTTQNSTWGYGCLWAPFVDESGATPTLNTFWVGAEMVLACSSTYAETDLAQYSPWVIRSSGSGAFLFFRAVIGAKNIFRLILGTDLTDTTKWVDTGIRYTATGTARNRYAIRIYGAGTNAASIILFVDGVRQGTWSGDMTLYKDFDSMSFHMTTPADALKLYYAVVTNFSIRRSYAKTRVATAVGSLTGWTGNVTPFATYPVNYNASGGLYAAAAGDQVTVTLPADAVEKSGYSIAALSMTAALVTDDDSTVASAAAIIKDTGTSKVTTLNAQSINADGQGYTWNIPVNPEDGTAWTTASLAKMEFGLGRTI